MIYVNYKELKFPQKGDPDIETVYLFQPEVIARYKNFCHEAGLEIYGGGTRKIQRNLPGKILSGYRNFVPKGGVEISPHFFCIALDIYVPLKEKKLLEKNLSLIPIALKHFSRIGIYPLKNSIHLDIADKEWMKKYGGKQFWYQDQNLKYFSFSDIMKFISALKNFFLKYERKE